MSTRTLASCTQGARVLNCNRDDKPLPTYTAPVPLIPKGRAPVIPSGPEYDDDEDGEGATTEGAPIPTRDEDGTLIFEGRWKGVFTPNVTPKEMFDGGAFGGGFFTYVSSFSHSQVPI